MWDNWHWFYRLCNWQFFFFFFWAKEPPIFRVSNSIFAHKPMIFTLLFLSRQPFHAQFDSVASCIEFKFNLANQLERWTSDLWRIFIAQISWHRSYIFVHLPLVGRNLLINRNKHNKTNFLMWHAIKKKTALFSQCQPQCYSNKFSGDIYT